MRIAAPVLQALVRAVDAKCNPQILLGPTGIRLSDRAVDVYFSPSGDDFADARGSVPGEWLLKLAKQAGRKGSIELGADEHHAIVHVGRVRYKNWWLRGPDALLLFPRPRAGLARRALDPADWTRGGAVALAADLASKDSTRQHVAAVHLDELVSGTDGHRAVQPRPVGCMAELDANVPVLAVRALLRLCAAAPPARLTCQRTPAGEYAEHGRIWFSAELPDGARWSLTTELAPPPPDIAGAIANAGLGPALSVDAADLRELPAPFGRDAIVAFYPDGLLCWSDNPDAGIGSTLPAGTTAPPVAVFSRRVLAEAVRRLPKSGTFTLRTGRSEPSRKHFEPAELCGQFLMPMNFPELPPFVLAALAELYPPPPAEQPVRPKVKRSIVPVLPAGALPAVTYAN